MALRLPFLEPRKIIFKVNGVDTTIHALPMTIIYELKGVVRPLARAIATLTESYPNDTRKQVIQFNDKSGDEYETTGQTNVDAISVELAELREKQKTLAIDQIIDAVTLDANRMLLGKVVCSSVRDGFDLYPIPNDDIQEFMDTVDIGTMIELIEGIFKANASIFAPLWDRVLQSLKDRIPVTQTESPTEPEETTTEKTASDVVATLGSS